MLAKTALCSAAFGPFVSWSCGQYASLFRPETSEPIPQTLLQNRPFSRKSKVLMPLRNRAITPFSSVPWTHNPYPSPSLWKTGRRSYKSLNLHELHSADSAKRSKKRPKSAQNGLVLPSFGPFFVQKRHFFSKKILGFHSLTFSPFHYCLLFTAFLSPEPWTLNPGPASRSALSGRPRRGAREHSSSGRRPPHHRAQHRVATRARSCRRRSRCPSHSAQP